MNEWISVEERLPEAKRPVLMVAINVGPRGDYTTDQYAGWHTGFGFVRWPHVYEPTHWMPLPEPPK